MALVLSEEQELLQQTAREFVRERSPVARFRKLRDERDESGFSRALWKEMAELGWVGIPFPETYGGGGMGFAELGIVLEELGRTLAPEPFPGTVLLGGMAVLLGGSDAQKQALLPGVCAGERFLALAYQEAARFDPYAIETKAQSTRGGFRLSGEKLLVLDGQVADPLVVAARTAGSPGEREGITLFLVDGNATGLKRTRLFLVDGRGAARIHLDGVEVAAEQVLGEPGRGGALLDRVLDRATIGLAAEMLGGAQEAFDRTVAYLKTREQFGQKIGSFQALKHRAATLFCEMELSRSVVMEALRAVDRDAKNLAELASAAKARISDTYHGVACEGIQMHGGIGMTDEEDIGLYLKRARVAVHTLGDAAYHRDRFARLSGY
jgi:acyl-CoA dehydrogenase